MSKIILLETIHHNEEWAKFLKKLPTDIERTIAGKTMVWIKKTYPEFKNKLNGKLIAEVTKQT